MVRIVWQDVPYEVRRVAVSAGTQARYRTAFNQLMSSCQLEWIDPSAEARPGDFWIGCSPKAGWGNADPLKTAWASSLEIEDALTAFNAVSSPAKTNGFGHLIRLIFPEPSESQMAFA